MSNIYYSKAITTLTLIIHQEELLWKATVSKLVRKSIDFIQPGTLLPFQRNPTLFPVLMQINPISINPPCFCNTVIFSAPWFSFSFPIIYLHVFIISPMLSNITSIPFYVKFYPNNIWWILQIMKSSLRNLFHSKISSFSLSSNIILRIFTHIIISFSQHDSQITPSSNTWLLHIKRNRHTEIGTVTLILVYKAESAGKDTQWGNGSVTGEGRNEW